MDDPVRFGLDAKDAGDPKAAANWVMGEVLARLNETGKAIEEFPVRPSQLAGLIALVKAGELSSTAAKTVLATLFEQGAVSLAAIEDPKAIAERLGLLQVGDDSALRAWIEEVLAEHPDEARRYDAGETRLQGVLVGFVMKKSKGRADPRKLSQILSARSGK